MSWLVRTQDQGWASVVSPDISAILQREAKKFDEFLQDNVITFREEYLNYCKRNFIENSFLQLIQNLKSWFHCNISMGQFIYVLGTTSLIGCIMEAVIV